MGIIICSECSTEYKDGSKFCRECGNDLTQKGHKTCRNCGAENSHDARFCFNCGQEMHHAKPVKKPNLKQLNHRKKTNKSIPPAKQAIPIPVKIAVTAFIVAAIYIIIPEDKTASSRQQVQGVLPISVSEQKLSDPAMEAAALDITSKFICSCGTCGEQPLRTCTCEVAKAERHFIRNSLANNKDADTIIRAVNKKYGWIKPEFEGKYGPGKFKLDLKQKPLLTSGLDVLDQKGGIVPASFTDRLSIISSFACTCGQCQIDELKDCECNHPGGATEVKKFIDQKITEAKYSKENIIQLVEAQYGNRIR